MATTGCFSSTFTLENGHQVPAVGLGTFQGDNDNSLVEEIVLSALNKGYRHIDGAAAYGNEKEIGRAIQRSGIPREELFITTKLSQTWHKHEDVAEALEQSLRNLGLDYVDLYLMHFPHAYASDPDHSTVRHPSGNGKPVIDYPLSRAYPETWKAMEKLVGKGKAKSIGLSNFNILKTKRLLEVAVIRPQVNQVELHPYLHQQKLLEFCGDEKIHLMAHQPLGGRPVNVVNPNASRPGPLSDPKIKEIALACGQTPAQVILSWSVQRGTSVVPKTIHEHRLLENSNLRRLNDQHFQSINSIKSESEMIRYLDPRGHIGFDIFDETLDEPVIDSAPWD